MDANVAVLGALTGAGGAFVTIWHWRGEYLNWQRGACHPDMKGQSHEIFS